MTHPTDDGLRRITRSAWTTRIEVLVPRDAPPAVETVVDRTLERIDRAASRFREDSEVSALARRAPDADGRVRSTLSADLADLLAAADRACRLTGGIVDPCLGGDVIAAGYGRAPGRPAPAGTSARRGVRWSDVVLDAPRRRIDLRHGTLLDLGATAKARTADHLAERLCALCGGRGVLVNLGGDIRTAGLAPGGGWVIDLPDAVAGAPGSSVRLADGAIATSSTRLRAWGEAGAHHIIDPRTGIPARTPWAEVSVIAGTCADANTAATCAVVLGDRAMEHLRAHGLAARLVRRDGSEVVLDPWPVPSMPPAPTDLPLLIGAA